MNCIKSLNELPSTLLFPGSLSESSYCPYSLPNKHRKVKLLFIPMHFQHSFLGAACCHIEYFVPPTLPAILILTDDDEEVYWDTIEDNSSSGSFATNPNMIRPSSSLFIIYFHSNAIDAMHVKYYAEREAEIFNANYLILEYPRFGFSGGHPTEEALNHCAQRVYHYVTAVFKVPPDRIVLYGRSIGTGPACSLASHVQRVYGHKIAAVILHPPFTSLRDVAADILGSCIHYTMLDRFPNWKVLSGDPRADKGVIRCPVLLLHADCDLIIDYEHSRVLHERRLHFGLPSSLHTQISTPGRYKGHNVYHFSNDLLNPIKSFLIDQGLNSKHEAGKRGEVPKQYIIPFDEIEQLTIVPKEYSHYNRDDSNESRSKINKEIICRWASIPCTQTMECCLASSIQLTEKLGYYFLGTQPTFTYKTKAMRHEAHTSCCSILYQVLMERSTENVINENDLSLEKVFNQRNAIDIRNPIFEDNLKNRSRVLVRSTSSELSPSGIRLGLRKNGEHSPRSKAHDFSYTVVPSNKGGDIDTESPLHQDFDDDAGIIK